MEDFRVTRWSRRPDVLLHVAIRLNVASPGGGGALVAITLSPLELEYGRGRLSVGPAQFSFFAPPTVTRRWALKLEEHLAQQRSHERDELLIEIATANERFTLCLTRIAVHNTDQGCIR